LHVLCKLGNNNNTIQIILANDSKIASFSERLYR